MLLFNVFWQSQNAINNIHNNVNKNNKNQGLEKRSHFRTEQNIREKNLSFQFFLSFCLQLDFGNELRI